MRMIEIFTSYESIRKFSVNVNEQDAVRFSKKLFSYMIDENYFRDVRKMIDEKIDDNTYDVATTRPHTEFSKVILEMLKRPLKLVNSLDVDENFDSKILASFIRNILAKESNNTIIYFILPSLAEDESFPFMKLINFLHNVHLKRDIADNNNQGESTELFKSVKFNCYLLYSLLHLDAIFLDEIIRHNKLEQYLVVIGSMIGCVSRLPKISEYSQFSNYDENDSSNDETSDSDDDQNDEEMQLQMERLILVNIVKALNEKNRVRKIVNSIDSILEYPNVIHFVCMIAHSLMIYNRNALSDYK
jgi:hypothetical protein